MKRRFLCFALAAVMASGMIGTGAFAEEQDYALTDAKFDNVQLKLYASLSDASLNYYNEKIDEFNKMDNGITVEITNINTEADYLDKLSTDFASGETPNVFMEYGGARCLDYIEADALVNLQPYLEADEEWYNGFMESCWEPAHFEDYGYEGLYCVPYTNYQIVLFYNKDILAENGV